MFTHSDGAAQKLRTANYSPPRQLIIFCQLQLNKLPLKIIIFHCYYSNFYPPSSSQSFFHHFFPMPNPPPPSKVISGQPRSKLIDCRFDFPKDFLSKRSQSMYTLPVLVLVGIVMSQDFSCTITFQTKEMQNVRRQSQYKHYQNPNDQELASFMNTRKRYIPTTKSIGFPHLQLLGSLKVVFIVAEQFCVEQLVKLIIRPLSQEAQQGNLVVESMCASVNDVLIKVKFRPGNLVLIGVVRFWQISHPVDEIPAEKLEYSI